MTMGEIHEVTGGELYGASDVTVRGICIDSRKCHEGELFIAFSGENTNGNLYASNALINGCSGAITTENIECTHNKAYIKVASAQNALEAIAKYKRQKHSNVKLVGITGSVGKTTTKEMVYSALSAHFCTHKTAGNFNNEIGLPITMAGLDDRHSAAVIEMGMSDFGEISMLSHIAHPNVGIITNIGLSHIETLKTQENILKAKMEILDGMERGSTLILNGDDKFLRDIKPEGYNVLYYGVENDSVDVSAKIINEEIISVQGVNIKMPVSGIHNVSNAAAAMAAAMVLNVPLPLAAKGIESYVPDGIRQTISCTDGGIYIMSDYYNASPQSVKAALSVLKNKKCGRRVAVLGDMLELGSFSDSEHLAVGMYAAECGIDVVVAVGRQAKLIADGAKKGGIDEKNVMSFDNNDSASQYLNTLLERNDMVLIKGSRGMKMEEIYEKIINAKEENL